jgi:uncharacterized protein YjaG (DUF416 family)
VSFDPISLKHGLDQLTAMRRVVFGAACCERLLPNYAAFAHEVQWGQPEILRAALDYVWHVIDSGNVDRAEINRLVEECDAVIPDTEDFDTSSVSAALDAGSAVVETLRALLDGDSQRIVDVASFCRDTVHMYIQDRDQLDYDSDPLFETKIMQDPLMERELGRQSAVLSELLNTRVFDRAMLNRLRGGGQSSIGRTAPDPPS